MRYIYVPVEKESELLEADNLELSEYQTLVGGWIEHIYLPGGVIAVVNEEGALAGLPVNTRATSVVSALLGRAQPIVGAAVFIGTGDNGDEADIPDGFVETWMHLLQ